MSAKNTQTLQNRQKHNIGRRSEAIGIKTKILTLKFFTFEVLVLEIEHFIGIRGSFERIALVFNCIQSTIAINNSHAHCD